MTPRTMLFICFLALLSVIQVHARTILIVCTEGCGCVTEYGVSVRCNFLPNNEFSVLRAKVAYRGRYYAIRRVVEVGTFSTFGDDFSSVDPGCPNSAGSNPSTKRAICVPAPRPTRLPPPMVPGTGIPVCNQDKKATVSLMQNETTGEGTIQINAVEDNNDGEADCPITAAAVFGRCRPRML